MILILYTNNICINIWVKCSGSLFQTDTALYITVFFKAFVSLSSTQVKERLVCGQPDSAVLSELELKFLF